MQQLKNTKIFGYDKTKKRLKLSTILLPVYLTKQCQYYKAVVPNKTNICLLYSKVFIHWLIVLCSCLLWNSDNGPSSCFAPIFSWTMRRLFLHLIKYESFHLQQLFVVFNENTYFVLWIIGLEKRFWSEWHSRAWEAARWIFNVVLIKQIYKTGGRRKMT